MEKVTFCELIKKISFYVFNSIYRAGGQNTDIFYRLAGILEVQLRCWVKLQSKCVVDSITAEGIVQSLRVGIAKPQMF